MTNQLSLRSIDIPSIHKFGIGFDSMLDDLLRGATQQNNNYPPYNIVQLNEDEYMIGIAVAGFSPERLEITKEKNFLIVEGKAFNQQDEVNYLHKGISSKSFRREFKLADYVDIETANLELGILSIHLKREVPEEQKPKSITINYVA